MGDSALPHLEEIYKNGSRRKGIFCISAHKPPPLTELVEHRILYAEQGQEPSAGSYEYPYLIRFPELAGAVLISDKILS